MGKDTRMKETRSIITEYWKPIKDYEGLYEVSNTGKVRSVDRFVKHSSGNGFRKVTGKILNTINHGDGYLYVTLMKDGKRKNHYIHRLVAETFIPKEDERNYVNHIDFNKSNNCVENLEWVTCKENVIYSLPYRKLRKPNINTGEYGVGIRLRKNKYEVETAHKYIGRFSNIEDAIKARDAYFEYERKEQEKYIQSLNRNGVHGNICL